MKTFVLLLDLIDDPALIAQYEAHHKAVWPEILASIADSGITSMSIYRVLNRLSMVMTTIDSFSFDEKGRADQASPIVQKWEALMWQFQQAIPDAGKDVKWMLAQQIFHFESPPST